MVALNKWDQVSTDDRDDAPAIGHGCPPGLAPGAQDVGALLERA